MPEGPELHFASRFINSICKNEIFGGRLEKSKSSKSPSIDWDVQKYTISAVSRGKELKLMLNEIVSREGQASPDGTRKSIDIVFKFGLSGRFRFDPVDEMDKHAHLKIYTQDKKKMLSFVDPRRFGSWDIGDWGEDRGPCVLSEYQLFRENVLDNLKRPTFNKPICDAMLDQKFFNGIGNYLRAEVLCRAGIPPFVKARDVLESLPKVVLPMRGFPDILQLCHIVPNEVINLTDHSGYDADADSEVSEAFSQWLRCYYKPGMKNMVDHNNRTIWYSGEPGPMAPAGAIERHIGNTPKKTSKAAFSSSVLRTTNKEATVVPTASSAAVEKGGKRKRINVSIREDSGETKQNQSGTSTVSDSDESSGKRPSAENVSERLQGKRRRKQPADDVTQPLRRSGRRKLPS